LQGRLIKECFSEGVTIACGGINACWNFHLSCYSRSQVWSSSDMFDWVLYLRLSQTFKTLHKADLSWWQDYLTCVDHW
jgi:hypothetical protein